MLLETGLAGKLLIKRMQNGKHRSMRNKRDMELENNFQTGLTHADECQGQTQKWKN